MSGILFASIDEFTREGFTHGLFLQVRELLQRAMTRGHPAGLVCIAQRKNPGIERRTRTVRGCAVRSYYDLMRQASAHAVSQTVADAFHSQTGVPAQVLPNLLPERRIGRVPLGTEGRFLTLVNHHPIKGRRVWDALIRQRRSDAYLVVETWPDAPAYTPPLPNVQVAPFAPDPTTIYNRTRILLVPSLGPEGLARVTLEAMESGVPVVAHRIGSLPELGNAAMFVAPPPITGYVLEGNVLYPVISPNDIKRAVQAFGQAVDAIDHDATLRTRFVADGKELVRDYRNHSEAVIGRLLDAWLGAV
ncbi:glycosyltransferase [Streptomyces sp. NBC_01275]|uniref:glycosyltransferase n=1 Tax=Streptomyces sp. NBC_01275 TaxID=2903807 RepID=UPI00224DEDA9|nr:glycosyltransferase [Streptomyces sp. NBC_01275]MCX4763800.1 glycosyltransferase [Streptomyces sp. NBC_01275]